MMEEDLRHYVHLLERGYTPEDALLVTATKFPDFTHEPTASPQPVETVVKPTESVAESPYNPYAPSPEIPQQIGRAHVRTPVTRGSRMPSSA